MARLVLLPVLLAGCGSTSTPTSIVGQWAGQYTENEFGSSVNCQLTIQADGSGTYILGSAAAQNMTWKQSGSTYTVTGTNSISGFSMTGTINGKTFSGTLTLNKNGTSPFTVTKTPF